MKHVLGLYCALHKHANSKVQKPPSQLRFSLPSIIITITSNEPGNTETHKKDRNTPITNHKPWPFEPVKVKFCFLRGSLRWLTAAKKAIVSWLLNFRIRMFVKSAVKTSVCDNFFICLIESEHGVLIRKYFLTNQKREISLPVGYKRCNLSPYHILGMIGTSFQDILFHGKHISQAVCADFFEFSLTSFS